jgi:hypothetical protein
MLLSSYQRRRGRYVYARPPSLPEAILPPGACPVKPSAISVELKPYEPASSNRNAAYSQYLRDDHRPAGGLLVGQAALGSTAQQEPLLEIGV